MYLAVVQRLDGDGVLRIVAAAGPLSEAVEDYLLQEQHVSTGVNGRVARTAAPALIADTRLDPDYLVRDAATDPAVRAGRPDRPSATPSGAC